MKKPNDQALLTRLEDIFRSVLTNRYSKFYQQKYQKAGFTATKISSEADFAKIPYLTRDEIANTKARERLFCKFDKSLALYVSSGTTDNPLIIYQKKYNFHPSIVERVQQLDLQSLLILRPVWVGQATLSTWQDFPVQKILGDLSALAQTAKVAAASSVDSLNGTATACIYFANYLEKEFDLKKIKWLWLGGEYISKAKLNLLKKIYPNAYPDITFISIETLNRGYRCSYLAKQSANLYHPMPDFYFEILKSDGSISHYGEGELIITQLEKNLPFPLIRYKSADLVKQYRSYCQCGEAEIIEVIGRSYYDSFKIAGVTLHTEMLEQAAIRSGIWPTFDYQLHIYEQQDTTNLKVQLVLKLTSQGGLQIPTGLVAEKFSKNFLLTPKLTLDDLVKRGVFSPLKVDVVAAFEKKYKQRRLVPHLDN